MPGSPDFYNKVSLWMREGALHVLHLSFNKVLSTVSHNVLAPSSGCYNPRSKGGRRTGWMSRLSPWTGLQSSSRPWRQPQDEAKVGIPPHTAGTGLLAKGMDRNLLNSGGSRAGPAQPRKEPLQWQAGGSNTSGPWQGKR